MLRHLSRASLAAIIAATLTSCSIEPTATVTIDGYGVTRHELDGFLTLFGVRNTSRAHMTGIWLMAECREEGLSQTAVFGPRALDLKPGRERTFVIVDFSHGRRMFGDGRITCSFEATNASSPPEPQVVLEVRASSATP